MKIRSEQPLIVLRESASAAQLRTTTPAPAREANQTDTALAAYKIVAAKCFEKLGFKLGKGESINDATRRVVAELFDDAVPVQEAAHQPPDGGRRLRESPPPRGIKVKFDDFYDDARPPTVLGRGQEIHQ